MNNTSSSSSSASKPAPTPYPPYSYPTYQIEEDEINLLDYWRVIVRYKVMIISITLLCTVVAVTAAFMMTPIYRAEALLAPVTEEQRGAMSALVSQFGGLASMAGVNIGSAGGGTEQTLATLKSRSFIDDFINDHQLTQVIFSDKWDSASKAWKGKSSSDIPTLLDAYSYFEKQMLNITQDKKTGLVTLSVDWKNPQQAAIWANELVSRINFHEKQLAIKEAEKSISYLKEQLAKTSVVEMQQAIYQLMEAQTKKIMLANVRDQYAFKIIDPAVAPEKRAKPNRKIIIGLGFACGLLLSIFIAIIKFYLKSHEGRADESRSASSLS